MRDQRDMMIQRQAEVISDLRAQLQKRAAEVDNLRREFQQKALAAHYYQMLQKSIMENETLQSEWRRFITIAKLSFDEPIEGLTKTDMAGSYDW